MKKIIPCICLFFICITHDIYGSPFVKFETGPSLNVENVYFTEAIIGYSLKIWEIESRTYGGWLTWAEYGKRCKPFMEIYSINQKFIYKDWFIRFQHYCAHTVNSKQHVQYDSDGNVSYKEFKATPYSWSGNMRTISVGFEYEFK